MAATTDIHVYLTEVEAEQLRRLAEREDRSITNMARKLMRDAMAELDKEIARKAQRGAS